MHEREPVSMYVQRCTCVAHCPGRKAEERERWQRRSGEEIEEREMTEEE